jgi:SH3-like domain-containing protein
MKFRIITTLAALPVLLFSSPHAIAACVQAEKANLRHGPSTSHQKTWEVYRYMPFKVLKREGDWARIQDLDSDIHWIHARLLSNNLKCAVVKVDRANVRSGPGGQHSTVAWSPVPKYYAFKILQTRAGWLEVEDAASNRGWINQGLVWTP